MMTLKFRMQDEVDKVKVEKIRIRYKSLSSQSLLILLKICRKEELNKFHLKLLRFEKEEN